MTIYQQLLAIIVNIKRKEYKIMYNKTKIITSTLLTAFALTFTACNSTATDNNSTAIDNNPTITLEGSTDINISLGTTSILVDGDKYSAYDPQDGDLSTQVQRTHNIDFTKAGVYTITYYVVDTDGNSDTKYRTVTIVADDYQPYRGDDEVYTGSVPIITFTDGKSDTIFLNIGESFDRFAFVANDFEDGDLTSSVTVTDDVDIHTQGVYTISYNVTDSDGNSVQRDRTINVSNYDSGTHYVEATEIDLFKTWYSETCGQQFDESLYNAATGEYNGKIDCSNSNLTDIDLTTLSIFSTIRSLDLSHNSLSYIDFNQLDLRENNVKVLEDLDLSYNNFSEIDFTPLHNLRNINRLWIQGNPALASKYNTKAKREALYKIFNNQSLVIYFDQY